MNEKETAVLRKLLEIHSLIISLVQEGRADEVRQELMKLQKTLRELERTTVQESHPIWTRFPQMTEDQIRAEFNDARKYPDLNSIKKAVKGYLELNKVTDVKNRGTLIDHIIERTRHGKFISSIGKDKVDGPQGDRNP